MLLALVAGSLVPPPVDEAGTDGEATSSPMDRGGEAAREQAQEAPDVAEVELRTGPGDGGKPVTRRELAPDQRSVVRVTAAEPGQVELEGLGLLELAGPGVPAEFDLFTDRSGTYPVIFTPTGGEPRTIGALVVRGRTASESRR